MSSKCTLKTIAAAVFGCGLFVVSTLLFALGGAIQGPALVETHSLTTATLNVASACP